MMITENLHLTNEDPHRVDTLQGIVLRERIEDLTTVALIIIEANKMITKETITSPKMIKILNSHLNCTYNLYNEF